MSYVLTDRVHSVSEELADFCGLLCEILEGPAVRKLSLVIQVMVFLPVWV